jgi:hypothetical protein
MKCTPEQLQAAKSVDRALRRAARAGLALRVFDDVLLMPSEHLSDPRYGLQNGPAMVEWMNECIAVRSGIDADGGSGV